MDTMFGLNLAQQTRIKQIHAAKGDQGVDLGGEEDGGFGRYGQELSFCFDRCRAEVHVPLCRRQIR